MKVTWEETTESVLTYEMKGWKVCSSKRSRPSVWRDKLGEVSSLFAVVQPC